MSILNLTNMFLGEDVIVPGGRLVKGRAMSGSMESRELVESELERNMKKGNALRGSCRPEVVKRRSETIINKTNDMYLEFMEGKDWMTAKQIASGLGTPHVVANRVMLRLHVDGKVELKAVRKSGGPGKPLRLWRKV